MNYRPVLRPPIDNGKIHTLCRQCDMHCGLTVRVGSGRIAAITGLASHPQNRGRICAKAVAARELVYHPDRLVQPLKRQPDGLFVPISLHRALDEIAEKMIAVRQRCGAGSVGVWTGEAVGFDQQADYARRFIHAFGSPNYFSAESVCFASRYIAAFLVQGFYTAVPDFAHADLIVLWGINPQVTHRPYWMWIEEAVKNGARLIVIDPRRTEAARRADVFAKIRPGTDGALAWGIANRLIETGGYDRAFVDAHTVGFESFARYAGRFTPDRVRALTGIPAKQVENIAQMITRSMPRVVHAPGISTEHQVNGVNTVRAIACLSGLCGAIDAKGGEVCHESPGTRNLTLYDTIPLTDIGPIGAEKFPVLYGLRRECHSISAMDAMLDGRPYPLRAVLMTGANPVLSNPNSRKVARALSALDLLVVRDLFMTPTARLAHYIIPAASFLERSEIHCYPHLHRLALSRKVLEAPGILDEYTFWRELAGRMGFANTYFPWSDETAVNRWLVEPTGITLAALADHPEGIGYAERTYNKFAGRPLPTASGKFELSSGFLASHGYPALPEYLAPAGIPGKNAPYPLVLITGARKSMYYHSRYRNIDRFRKAVPKAEMEIHPKDAHALEIGDGENVRVVSAIGRLVIRAKILDTDDILPGVLQITHGWESANVNLLTDDTETDPISGLPNMKVVRVRVEKL